LLHVAGGVKEVNGVVDGQVQRLIDALLAKRGEAGLQQGDGRSSEAGQAGDVAGEHGVGLAAGDDRADEGGGPHVVRSGEADFWGL
jgi:hypothetical protein